MRERISYIKADSLCWGCAKTIPKIKPYNQWVPSFYRRMIIDTEIVRLNGCEKCKELISFYGPQFCNKMYYKREVIHCRKIFPAHLWFNTDCTDFYFPLFKSDWLIGFDIWEAIYHGIYFPLYGFDTDRQPHLSAHHISNVLSNPSQVNRFNTFMSDMLKMSEYYGLKEE